MRVPCLTELRRLRQALRALACVTWYETTPRQNPSLNSSFPEKYPPNTRSWTAGEDAAYDLEKFWRASPSHDVSRCRRPHERESVRERDGTRQLVRMGSLSHGGSVGSNLCRRRHCWRRFFLKPPKTASSTVTDLCLVRNALRVSTD